MNNKETLQHIKEYESRTGRKWLMIENLDNEDVLEKYERMVQAQKIYKSQKLSDNVLPELPVAPNILNVYRFNWDCGRQGRVEGVFISTSQTIEQFIGRDVYFGEILGKHSEVYGTLNDKDLNTIPISDEDAYLIMKVLTNLNGDEIHSMLKNIWSGEQRSCTLTGYNPLTNISGEDY